VLGKTLTQVAADFHAGRVRARNRYPQARTQIIQSFKTRSKVIRIYTAFLRQETDNILSIFIGCGVNSLHGGISPRPASAKPTSKALVDLHISTLSFSCIPNSRFHNLIHILQLLETSNRLLVKLTKCNRVTFEDM
jgi:hypothetical protein